MRCEQAIPYLPGLAGGDLRPETAASVEAHLASCPSCRTELARYERVGTALASLREREVEPPAYLLESLLETVPARRARRRIALPLPPVPPQELIRVVQDNREAIAQAAGAAVVAAGAAWALWRALRGRAAAPEATA